MPTKRAGDVNIGDVIVTKTGNHRITGWYVDGKGHMVLEYNGRWHTHFTNDRLEVIPCAR